MPVRRRKHARPARSLTLARTPASRARAQLRAALAQVGGLVGNANGPGRRAAPLLRSCGRLGLTEKALAAPLFAPPARGGVMLRAVPHRSLPLCSPNVFPAGQGGAPFCPIKHKLSGHYLKRCALCDNSAYI